MSAAARDLTTLLRLRLRLFPRWLLARYTRNPRGGRTRLVLLLAGLLAFAGLIIPTLSRLFGVTVPEQLGRYFLAPSLSQGLSVMGLLIIFYATVSLIATLTYASDLKLLLLTPVSPRLLMAEKMLSVMLGFLPLLLLSLAPILAIGHRLNLGPVYDIMAVFTVLLVPFSPVALAMLLVLAVLHWLPPARARTVGAILGTTVAGIIFVVTQAFSTSSLTPQGGPASLPAALPSTWPGRSLAAAGLGDAGTATLYLLASILLAVALITLAIVLSAHLFTTGWATYQEVGRGKEATDVRESPAVAYRLPRPRAEPAAGGRQWRPLLDKEWLALRRDARRLATLAYPLVIAGFFLYRILTIHSALSPGSPSVFTGFLAGSFYFMLTFMGVLLVGSVVPPVVNGEGRSLYLLALAPIRPRDILAAKWVSCTVPPLILVEALLVAGIAILHIPPGQAIFTAITMAALAPALAGIVITINLLWPRLDEESSRHQASFVANMIGLLGEGIVGGGVCTLLILTFLWWSNKPAAAITAAIGTFLVCAAAIGIGLTAGPRLLQGLLDGTRTTGT